MSKVITNRFPLGGSLLVGQLVGILLAMFFVWIQWAFLPLDDQASRFGFFQGFLDPFVLSVLVPTAFISGLVASIIVHFVISGRNIRRSFSIIIAVTFLWVGITTPFSTSVGLFGVFPAVLVALCFCRFSKFTAPIIEMQSPSAP